MDRRWRRVADGVWAADVGDNGRAVDLEERLESRRIGHVPGDKYPVGGFQTAAVVTPCRPSVTIILAITGGPLGWARRPHRNRRTWHNRR